MTLTVCLQGKDGLVLAADSRGTFGDPRGITAQNDTIKKIYLVGSIGILSAGGQQGNIIIEETGRNVEAGKVQGVTAVMQEVRKVARQRFDEWFTNWPRFPIPGQSAAYVIPTLQLTIAGYDQEG